MSVKDEKIKKIKATMKQLNKKYGKKDGNNVTNIVDFGQNKEEELKVKFYKTPSLEFNIMLGGGVGVGKLIELFGNYSSGKTSLGLEIIAYNQKLDPNFIGGLFETESSYDPEYAKMLGIDLSRFVYWDQRDFAGAEEGLEVLRGIVASGQCNMIMVNSVSGLLPTVENESDLVQQQVGMQARLMSKLMRVINGSASKTGTSLVFINQIREKVGVMFGNPETTSGGRALSYYASQRIKMTKVKEDKSDPITADTGLKVRCKTVKNRLAKGNPYKKCDYFVEYGKGINSVFELPNILERENIIRKAGAWIYYEDEKGKPYVIDDIECKFNSKKAFIKALKNSDILKKHFENLIYNRLNDNDVGDILNVKDKDIQENLTLEKEQKEIINK